MAQFSTPLIEFCTEKPTGTSSAFDPDYLYLSRIPRKWSGPILGIGLRAPTGGGTVVLALVSDEKQQPNEVLFKTELPLPNGKDSAGYTTLVAALPEPLIGHDVFWIGFRFSMSVEVPLRLAAFTGKRTAARMDFAQLSGSLLNTPMERLINDERLGLPILFPILGEFGPEVNHGK